MVREDVVIRTVNRWFKNPFLMLLLGFVCGRGGGGRSRLEIALRKYVGEEVPCGAWDRLAALIIKLMVDRGRAVFDYPKEELRKYLRDPVIRRGMVNVLEGIARYGARRPFITISPFLVVWNYTKLCNLRCPHCYENAGPDRAKDELTTEEAKRAVDEFEDAGVVAIAFSGGEPLLREDVFEVASYAKGKGFFTSIATNGTLVSRKLARKMKGVFDYAEISLDGFEDVHDKFRGVRGSWEKTCEGIKNCVAEGLHTCVAIAATRYNFKEIPELIDFVEDELGAERVIVFNFVPVARGREMIDKDLDPLERQELLEHLHERMMNSKMICYSTAPQFARVSLETAHEFKDSFVVSTHFSPRWVTFRDRRSLADFLGGCGAGRLYCGLEPNGDITPCVFMPIRLGNIKEDRLRDIWHSSQILWKLRERDSLEGCGRCEYRYVCGGCRARAYGYFSDVQAPDPGCIRNIKYWWELSSKNGSTRVGTSD